MEIYIATAIAFAIMYYFRYIREIQFVVQGVAKIHDAEPEGFNPKLFGISSFLRVLVAMPFYAIPMLWQDRMQVVRKTAQDLLIKYYDLELKK